RREEGDDDGGRSTRHGPPAYRACSSVDVVVAVIVIVIVDALARAHPPMRTSLLARPLQVLGEPLALLGLQDREQQTEELHLLLDRRTRALRGAEIELPGVEGLLLEGCEEAFGLLLHLLAGVRRPVLPRED